MNPTKNFTSLIKFPDHLLIKIFSYLQIRDRLRLQRVDRRFHRLALHQIERLHYESQQEYRHAQHKAIFDDTFDLACVLDCVLYRNNELDHVSYLNFLIKSIGYSLKKVYLALPSSKERKQYDIHSLITSLNTHCPQLTSFSFKNWHHGSMRECNAIALFVQHFGGQLEEFGYIHDDHDHNGCPFIQLDLGRYLNSSKLRKLNCNRYNTKNLSELDKKFPHLNYFQFSTYNQSYYVRLPSHLHTLVCDTVNNLNWLLIHDLSSVRKLVLGRLWIGRADLYSFQQFTNLQSLTVTCQFPRQFAYICRHLTRLKFLSVKLQDDCWAGEELNLDQICNLHNLQTLKMNFFRIVFFDEWIHMPPITSLRSLKLSKMISSKHCRPYVIKLASIIPRAFPNVEILHLKVAGLYEDEIRRCVVRLPKLKHFLNFFNLPRHFFGDEI